MYGGGLEYFNGTEWEVVYPYQHRQFRLMALPNEKLGYARTQETMMIRRWGDRLPDGKYRYVKLIWDCVENEYCVKFEFDIKKPA